MNTSANFLAQWEMAFIQYRPFLISFSFRMTGSLAQAEDIVQDAFIACAETDPAKVINHKSWLTRICSNKSLDHLKSASHTRESYPGVWLPDAVPDSFQYWGNLEESVAPEKRLLNQESLTTSFLLLLQKLGPEERVVYLLSDIFEYSFQEIGEFLQKSEDACKKIAQRARKAFENHKRFLSNLAEDQKIVAKFFDAAKSGDTDAVMAMLSPDSEFWPDGGGKVSVASKSVITDLNRTAAFYAGLWSSPKTFIGDGVKQGPAVVNGRPGWIISVRREDGEWEFNTVMSFEIENGRISRIFTQRNPDKLKVLLFI